MARALSFLRWLVASAVILCAAAAGARALQPVRVVGGSMRPALAPGDVALVRRGGAIASGDIILVAEPSRARMLHRALRQAANGSWQTRGDANPIADLSMVPSSAISGRVVAVIPVGHLLERWRASRSGATLANQSDSSRR